MYSDVHTAAEKLNFGGQQLAPPPAGLTFIQDSSGFSAKTLVDPETPEGYELVFGPTNGANNAPGVSLRPLFQEPLIYNSYSTWDSLSLIGTMSTHALPFATLVVRTARVAPVSSSTSGALLLMVHPQHTRAAW